MHWTSFHSSSFAELYCRKAHKHYIAAENAKAPKQESIYNSPSFSFEAERRKPKTIQSVQPMQNMLLDIGLLWRPRRAIVLVVTLRCENEKNQVVNCTYKMQNIFSAICNIDSAELNTCCSVLLLFYSFPVILKKMRRIWDWVVCTTITEPSNLGHELGLLKHPSFSATKANFCGVMGNGTEEFLLACFSQLCFIVFPRG